MAVLVDVDGKPKDVKVLKSTNEIFNFEALDAARQWLFSPAILNKKPAKFWLHIPIDFKLSSKGSLDAVNETGVVIFGDIFFKSKAPSQKKDENVIHINPDEYTGRGYIVVDVEPVLVQRVEPNYPPTAYANKVEGQVIVSLLLDVDGKVLQAKVLKSSNEIFNENALVAVKQWVFKPAILNEKPIKYWYRAPIDFKIK